MLLQYLDSLVSLNFLLYLCDKNETKSIVRLQNEQQNLRLFLDRVVFWLRIYVTFFSCLNLVSHD